MMDEIKPVAREIPGAFQQTQAARAYTQDAPQDPQPPPPAAEARQLDEQSPHPHRGQNLNTTI
jgi:hypothetical protein